MEAARENPAAANVDAPQDVDYRLPPLRDVDMRTTGPSAPISQRMLSRALAGDRDQAARAAHDTSVVLSTASASVSVSTETATDSCAPEQRVRWVDVRDEATNQMVVNAEPTSSAHSTQYGGTMHQALASPHQPRRAVQAMSVVARSKQRRKPLTTRAELEAAAATLAAEKADNDVEIDETLLADDAGDDTASQVSDETFEEIDQQLVYDTCNHEADGAGNAAPTTEMVAAPVIDSNAEAVANKDAALEAAGVPATTAPAQPAALMPAAGESDMEADTADTRAGPSATSISETSTVNTVKPAAGTRSKTTSPFSRRVTPGADETLSKRRRRQPAYLSLPSSSTSSDYNERIGIFNLW